MTTLAPSPVPLAPPPGQYIHGSDPAEQERLSALNELVNRDSIRALNLRGGERVLDVGCGLGQLCRAMARETGSFGRVVGIERDPMQWARAHRLAFRDGEASLVDLRLGDVYAPPLHADEWGTFDVVHARFVLEHLPDPLAAVKVMMRALRPGGRMILQEPDHSLIRLRPEPAGFAALWRAYLHVYSELGCNPNIGCDIVGLLHAAGMRPQRSTVLFSGGCAGDEHFHAHARHFADMVNGAHDRMLATGTIEPHELQQSIRALYHWCHQDGVALWMPFTWAAAIRP